MSTTLKFNKHFKFQLHQVKFMAIQFMNLGEEGSKNQNKKSDQT